MLPAKRWLRFRQGRRRLCFCHAGRMNELIQLGNKTCFDRSLPQAKRELPRIDKLPSHQDSLEDGCPYSVLDNLSFRAKSSNLSLLTWRSFLQQLSRMHCKAAHQPMPFRCKGGCEPG